MRGSESEGRPVLSSPSPTSSKLWGRLLKWAVSIGLLTYLFLTIDIAALVPLFKGLHLGWLVLVLVLTLPNLLLLALRWSVLLRSQGVRLSVRRALQLQLIGAFFNCFSPSTVGGDAVRAYHLAALKGKGADSVVSVILERALGLVSLAIIATLGCIFGYDLVRDTGAVTAVAILCAILGAAALLFLTSDTWLRLLKRVVKPKRGTRLKALAGKVNALHDSVAGFRSSPLALAAGLGLTLVNKLAAICLVYLLARALGIRIHVGYFFIFGPIRECIMMIPISINGIGIREATAVFFYTQAGMTEPQALAFGLLVYAVRLAVSATGGVTYACSGSFKRPETGHGASVNSTP